MPPLPPPQPPRRRGRLLAAVGVLLVVVAAVVGVLVVGGGGDGDSASDTSVARPVVTVPGGVAPAETQPISVTGGPLPPLTDSADDAAIGLSAPALSGHGLDGAPIEIEPGGAPKMLVFLAHWCPECNREIPQLLAWEESGRVPEGLEIIGVSTAVDTGRDGYPPSEWLGATGWRWPVIADSGDAAAAEAYGVTGFPYFVVIGTDGTVKVRVSGELETAQLDGIVRSAIR